MNKSQLRAKKFWGMLSKIFLPFFDFRILSKKFLHFSKIFSAIYSKLQYSCQVDKFKQKFWFEKFFFYLFPPSEQNFCWTNLGRIFKTGLLPGKGILWVRIGFWRYFISIFSKYGAETYRLSDIYFSARLSKKLSTCPKERKDFVLKN